MALTLLQRRDERMQALVDVVSELASTHEPRVRLAGVASGLDIHYDLGEGHPLLGRRMPDLDLATAAVRIRPDGYVAWVGEGTRSGLAEALTTWFGAPAEPTCRPSSP